METLRADGFNGQITFDGTTVTITREGFRARAMHGRSEKSLNIRSIGAVQWKPASALVNGWVQFSVSGESSKKSIGFGKSQDAASDENAVVFLKKQMPAFEALRDAVRDAIARGGAPAAAAAPDLTAQLSKLAELRDQGVLTEEEFTAKKADILNRM